MNNTRDVAGVWSREWEEDPLGATETRDTTTLVWWIQSAAGVYVDLRLPVGSPGRFEVEREGLDPDPLALTAIKASSNLYQHVLSRPSLLNEVLLKQKSFAGVLERTDGDTTKSGEALKQDKELSKGQGKLFTCQWNRHIDFQPPSGGLDLGVCRSEPAADDGSVFMRETGDDASYAEGWRKYGGSTEPSRTLTLASENGMEGLRKGFWVRVGTRFGYAIGRPLSEDAATKLGCQSYSCSVASDVGKTLEDSLPGHYDLSERLNAAMSYVVVAGTIDKEGNWNIQYSTNPELVGALLPEGTVSEDGKQQTQVIGSTVRVWNILD